MHRKRNSAFSLFCCAVALAFTAFVVVTPTSAEATVTQKFFELTAFVPCANGGTGEPVGFSGTIKLVYRDGEAVHGNWQDATGIGWVTHDTYIALGTTANLVPVGAEGEYLAHMSYIAPDGAKFTITFTGGLFESPTEILQVSCLG